MVACGRAGWRWSGLDEDLQGEGNEKIVEIG